MRTKRLAGFLKRLRSEYCPVSPESVRERTATVSDSSLLQISHRGRNASLPVALGRGWAEAEAVAHALPELFPLLRGHIPTALFHAPTKTGTTGTVPGTSAEEDAAQREDPQRLPEGNLVPSEERRQQPIPQLHHYFAADGDKCHDPQNCQRSNENQLLQFTHVQYLTLS